MRLLKDGFDQVRRSSRSLTEFAMAICGLVLCEKRKSDRHRLRDNEGVPLICPTCQVLAQSVLTGDRLLLCMGLFSIFLVGSQSDAAWLREYCLKPHTPTRPLL